MTHESELVLGSPFSDHMVLNAGKPVRLWGWDRPGEPLSAWLEGPGASG